MRRAILERFRERHGTLPIGGMERRHILALLDGMAPFAARNWLKAIRGLLHHCVNHEILRQDPTQGIRLPRTKSEGIHTWTEDEIAIYEAKHAIGTKPRLALALGLYTGQRRGDVVRMGLQHIREGTIAVRQQKTRASLSIPLHEELRAVLDGTPCGHLTLLVTKTGKSYAANDFSEQFRAWCNEAGLPPACSFHGLRKAACRRLAEAGCTPHEIAAITGHKSLREIERYTRAVDHARLARAAMARTEQNPDGKCQNEPAKVSNILISLKKKAAQ
jgi:integrase